VERLVPVHTKTNVPGPQSLLRGKFASQASNGSCMEEIWKRFKETVFESIDCFVPHKILRKNPDPEYYNKEVTWLTVKVRKVYSKRKIRTALSSGTEKTKELLAAKKLHRKHFCGQYYEMKTTAGMSSTSM